MNAQLSLLMYILILAGIDGQFDWFNIWLAQMDRYNDMCNGMKQSPIPLLSAGSLPPAGIQPLEFLGYEQDPIHVSVINDGHTVVFMFQYPYTQHIIAQGGPLRGRFRFASLHFHWGASSERGAEHVVDGFRYSMEMHLVFFNEMYGSFLEARDQPNGLSVLGVFFHSMPTGVYYGWVPALGMVQYPKTSFALPDPSVFNIQELIGSMREPYFSYRGSLTTPPCSETVTWIVQKRPLAISEEQLGFFRMLQDEHGQPMVDNYRALQHANGRIPNLYRQSLW
ncbi:carbonic anhydrase 7-like [Topomyia yanbarensis]|uniref:carbonic anhydrase 7-like n=1 Tax=Topomyia yanbarensis TaxID=2498891 RepID=UPI00273C585C|nr:carbonic anhydrase 7-like [Topomyia yanbarensis]XP_058812797.1 carbonic anhydrase 7-like [Topomyia yanbarensis]